MNGCADSGGSKTDGWSLARTAALRERLRFRLSSNPRPSRIWVAYSGGRDSHVLLHLLAGLSEADRGPLSASHIDHGLHPESGAWAAHCARVCERLGVPLSIERLRIRQAPGDSLEAVARDARWAAWERLLSLGEQLWLAHHQDDQAETLLLALLRGSGLAGLAAMPAERRLGAGVVVRPLLEAPGADLARCAESEGLVWVEDPSNQKSSFDRNFLRLRVLPQLRERWPAASATLTRCARHCADGAALIEHAAEGWMRFAAGSAHGSLSIGALQALEPRQRHAVLRCWLRRQGFRPPGRLRLAEISRAMRCARADSSPVIGWPGCEVRRYRDDLFAMSPLPAAPPVGICCDWDCRQSLQLGYGLGELSLLENDSSEPRLQVAFRLSGLRCRTRPGGPSRTLKAVFQQRGVPAWLRPHVPLILMAGKLIAIGGVCVCDGALPALHWQHPFGAGFGLAERVSRNG